MYRKISDKWVPPEAALAADWKWGCGGRSPRPPPGARTKFGMPNIQFCLLTFRIWPFWGPWVRG